MRINVTKYGSVRKLCATVLVGVIIGCSSLIQANAVAAVTAQLSVAPFVFASTRLYEAPTAVYQPWFENGSWQGDLIEYSVSMDGHISTDVNVGQNPPQNGAVNWSARAVIADRDASIPSYWRSTVGRQIVTYDGNSQVPFRWDYLTNSQRNILDSGTANAGGSFASPVLNYIRGDRTGESATGLVRQRHSLLGDIQNSQPIFVGSPEGQSASGFADFANQHKNRAGRIYVGANDGLLHAFDATSGAEVYAYAPSMLFSKLNLLTKQPYSQMAMVDGELAVADVLVGNTWKTVLVGGLGAGAKGLFALDVTHPNMNAETSQSSEDIKVMFEKTGSDTRLGYVSGRPRIAELPDNKSYLVSGNGVGSSDGRALLYLVNLQTSATSIIQTNNQGSNGLAAPVVIDSDNDGQADTAYAGDLRGNVWYFDLKARSSRLLYASGTNQPFTAAPDVTRHPSGGFLVFMVSGDRLSATPGAGGSNAVYGLWDKKPGFESPISNSKLQQQYFETLGGWRFATRQDIDWTTQLGWKTELSSAAEKIVGNPQIRSSRVQFVTAGASDGYWFLQLDWLTGGDSEESLFDINGNGLLDSADQISHNGERRTPAGRLLTPGNFSQPAYAHVDNGRDLVLINGWDWQTVAPPSTCSGGCAGGLVGGHVDVDTDTNLGSSTNAHVHEYDDKFSITYMDYLNLSGGSLENADEAVGRDIELVAIIANADLSPGGVISIGNKQWNVVDYQEMVQEALENWDGSSALLDSAGEPLIFSLNSINNNLRIAFDDQAIVNGGLHPTQTSCVKNSLQITNGRWRNGALTFQLLRASELKAGTSPVNAWVAQNPSDLSPGLSGGGIHGNLASSSGFAYESTLFWHYDGVCYGDSDWEETVTLARAEAFDSLYGGQFPTYQSNVIAINTLFDDLENYTCALGVGDSCSNEAGWQAIENELISLVGNYQQLAELLNGGSSSNISSTPSETTNTSGAINPALGPNYTLGRRAWTDIRQ